MNFLIFHSVENNIWLDWINAIGSLLVGLGTIGLLIVGLLAKGEWFKEQNLKVLQQIFDSLAHLVNWLNDLYDFAIGPEHYHGQKSQEKEFIKWDYNTKKNFIINGCQNAIEEFKKVNFARYRVFIQNKTGKKLKEYLKELEDIFDMLKQENSQTGLLVRRLNKKRPACLERFDLDEADKLKEIINLLRTDLNLKELN